MSKIIITQQDETDVEKFLLYLARNADEKRFYPFPDFYRITTQGITPNTLQDTTSNTTQKTNTSQQEEKKSTANDRLSKCGFKEYTQDEYDAMYRDLKVITDDRNIGSLTQKQLRLKEYITNIPTEIVLHSGSAFNNINEYQFVYSPMIERKRDTLYKKRWYLFHGSRLGNWHSIIRNGIKSMSGSRFMSTGQAYGEGVYMTPNFNIAYNYGAGTAYTCVAVVELFEDPTPYGKENCGFYVVPNDSILVPRFLYSIKYKTNIPMDQSNVLKYHEKNKNKLLEFKPLVKRVQKEIDVLEKSFVVENVEPYIEYNIIVEGILLNMNLDGYPRNFPLIRLKYTIDKALDIFDEQGYLIIDDINNWSPICKLINIFNKVQDIFKQKFIQMTDKEITNQIK